MMNDHSDRPVIGMFFEAGSGRHVLGEFYIDHAAQSFSLTADGENYFGSLSDLKIEPPLGSLPQKIYLPDGGLFQSDDLEAMAAILPKSKWHLLTSAESFGPHLLPITLILPVVTFAVYRLIMPLIIILALGLTPTSLIQQMDKSAIKTFDKLTTRESHISYKRQAEISLIFEGLLEKGESHRKKRRPQYELLFRGGRMGPNAFALPGGTIVITDALVDMFPNDDDVIAGILAHEIGHVEMEHSLRRLYRALGLAAMLGLIAGDSGAIVEDVIVEGSALLSLSFSRRNETESDNFAVDLLYETGRDPAAMAKLFERIKDHVHVDTLYEDNLPLCSAKDINIQADAENTQIKDETDTPLSVKDVVATEDRGIVIDEIDLDPLVKTKDVHDDCREDLDASLEIKNPKQTKAPKKSKINTEWISTHPLGEKRIENIRKRAARLRNQ